MKSLASKLSAGLAALALAGSAFAEANTAVSDDVAIATLHGIEREHYAPRMQTLAIAAHRLRDSSAALCNAPTSDALASVQNAWIATMLAWEAAGAVATGPLLERHTEANIDFWPTRPNMVEAGMQQLLPDTRALRRTGVAGRGLPALEWVLWMPAPKAAALADPRACTYAALLARDVDEEAQGLRERFGASANTEIPGPVAQHAIAELLNQTVGAVETLRRKRLFNPATVGNPKAFARWASAQTQPAWNARWSSIRNVIVGQDGGSGTIVALLVASGDEQAAAQLRETVEQASAALSAASPERMDSVLRAAEALMSVRRLLEQDAAETLHIPTRFSDFDGD
jgi:predicted lipoprotein